LLLERDLRDPALPVLLFVLDDDGRKDAQTGVGFELISGAANEVELTVGVLGAQGPAAVVLITRGVALLIARVRNGLSRGCPLRRRTGSSRRGSPKTRTEGQIRLRTVGGTAVYRQPVGRCRVELGSCPERRGLRGRKGTARPARSTSIGVGAFGIEVREQMWLSRSHCAVTLSRFCHKLATRL
jgi:hypothetical protein